MKKNTEKKNILNAIKKLVGSKAVSVCGDVMDIFTDKYTDKEYERIDSKSFHYKPRKFKYTANMVRRKNWAVTLRPDMYGIKTFTVYGRTLLFALTAAREIQNVFIKQGLNIRKVGREA